MNPAAIPTVTPEQRRRIRRSGLIWTGVAVFWALASVWFVRHHWIYPAPVHWWRFK